MSEELRALAVAGITGPFAILLDRVVTGFLRRRQENADASLTNAEASLTLDERWEKYTDRIEGRMKDLEGRVTELEAQLEHEQNRAKGLEAEVDRYRSIARSLLRHVLRLREALGRTDVEVPPIPQDIEDALTGIDLP